MSTSLAQLAEARKVDIGAATGFADTYDEGGK
jgi:hypothetical protein